MPRYYRIHKFTFRNSSKEDRSPLRLLYDLLPAALCEEGPRGGAAGSVGTDRGHPLPGKGGLSVETVLGWSGQRVTWGRGCPLCAERPWVWPSPVSGDSPVVISTVTSVPLTLNQVNERQHNCC